MRAVLERDLLAQGTRTRAFVVRGIVAGAAALAVLAGISATRWSGGYLDRGAFRMASFVTLVALVALAPAASVDAVLAERRQNTLPLVLASPVGPLGFVVAKFLSRAGLVFALLAAALPPLASCLFLDGGDFGRGPRFAVLAAAVVLEMTAFGVLVSSFCRRLESAAALSMVLPALRWGLTGYLAARLGDRFAPGNPVFVWVGYGLTPLDFLASRGGLPELPRALSPPPGGIAGPLLARPERMYLLLAALLALACVAACARRLARGEPAAGRVRWIPRGAGLPAVRWPRLLDRNPVFWKDALRLLRPGRLPALAVLLAAGAAGFALWIRGLGAGRPPSSHLEVFSWEVAGVSLLSAVQCASVLAHERACGGLEFLRLTPLSPGSILAGKVLAAGLAPLAGFAVAAVHLASATAPVAPGTLYAGLALAVVLPCVWGLVGLRWGLVAPSPGYASGGAAFAVLLSFLGCGWWLALPMVLIASDFFGERTGGRFTGTVVVPALLLGPPSFVTYHLLAWVDAAQRPGSWQGFGVRPEKAFTVFACLFLVASLLWFRVHLTGLAAWFRREMDREEDLARSARHFPTLREVIERRRLEREERKRGIRAPSREWREAKPHPPPDSPPHR